METPSSVAFSGLGLILFIVHLIFFISGTSAVSASALCYTGNGTVSTDFPCNPSQDTSFCCGAGWSCLSNGLCQYRDSTSFAEGTCTDKTFPANTCLGICLASGNQDQTLVHDCGGSGNGDTNSWCCAGVEGTTGQGQDCCSLGATTSLGPYPYSTITVISAVSRSSAALSSFPSTGSSISLHSIPLPTNVQAISSIGSTSSSSLSPTPPVSSMSTSSTLSPTSAPAPSSDNHSVAYGAGIGIPLGILVFAALAMLLYRDRRNKKAIQRLQASLPMNRKEIFDQEPEDVRHELATGIDRGELPTGRERQELP